MLCLLIKKGEEELESSKTGIFVKVIAIGATSPEQPPIVVRMVGVGGSFDIRCNTEELIPLTEHCIEERPGEQLQDILQRENLQIVKNFGMMFYELRRQVEVLQSTVNGVALEGLKKTQEHLREHELKPH